MGQGQSPNRIFGVFYCLFCKFNLQRYTLPQAAKVAARPAAFQDCSGMGLFDAGRIFDHLLFCQFFLRAGFGKYSKRGAWSVLWVYFSSVAVYRILFAEKPAHPFRGIALDGTHDTGTFGRNIDLAGKKEGAHQ